jgi:UDP-N-acetylglucosamine 2-epimerase (non-hydrolysing)
MKVVTVFGIRPDWTKGCRVLEELDSSKNLQHIVVHAGQHYSYNLDKVFFDELGIRKPDYNLAVGSGTHGQQTAKVIEKSEEVFMKEKPDLVLVLGDSNSSLAAISAAKLNIPVAKIEAGTRTYNWITPEEKNKVIVDHIGYYLFSYIELHRENLLLEGIPQHKIFVTGNPTADTIEKYSSRAEETKAYERFGLEHGDYFLVTIHRAETVDDPDSLGKILASLDLVQKQFRKKMIWPLYPRTKNQITKFGLRIPDNLIICEPLGYLEFLNLQSHSLCIITDSGTVLEEGCILRVPCVTLRVTTDRPETVLLGSNIVAGLEPKDALDAVKKMLGAPRNWSHPYGRGADRKIAEIIRRHSKKNLIELLSEMATNYRVVLSTSPYVRKSINRKV